MTTTPKMPKNKDEEAALEKALAEYKKSRIQVAKDFLDSDQAKAFKAAIEAIIEEGLPTGSSAFAHLQQIPAYLTQTDAAVQNDLTFYDRIINPPEVVVPAPTDMLPSPTPAPPPTV